MKSGKNESESKWAILTPKKQTDGRWMVSLGNVDGKYPRKFFKTRADAQLFCNDERARRKVHGSITAEADGVKVSQWMQLDELLEKTGIKLSTIEKWIALEKRMTDAKAGSLLESGSAHLDAYLSVKKTGTAKECFEAFHTALIAAKRRGKYRADSRNRCGRFLRWFGDDKEVLNITPQTIEAYLATLKNKGDFKTISAWLGWAAKNRWLPANPCAGLRPEEPAHVEVITLSPADAAEMLRRAVKSEEWDVLAHIAISLFAGLRPDEFRKIAKGDDPAYLLWEYIKSEHISVPPALSKNGRRSGQGRTVPIEPTLRAWLDFIREKLGPPLCGPVLRANWKKAWENWRKTHWLRGNQKWPKDVLRHSFGSYHLARGRSPEVTAFLMENSPKILKKHYWAWETLGPEATAYWELTPTKVLKA
ncbi:MAG: hypothetical protein QM627_12330 [Luteolibacter sp.]